MDETGHENVVHDLMDLQARLRSDDDPPDGSEIASVTRLPVTVAPRDRLVVLTERLERVERDLDGLSDRLRRLERADRDSGSVGRPAEGDGAEPDLVLDLQRLVAGRLQADSASVDDAD